MRTVLALIVLTIVVALALTLGAENQQIVRLNYLLAQDEFRLSTLLVILFTAGFFCASLLFGLLLLRARVSLHRLRRQQARLVASSAQTEKDASR
ncbi:MAG: LapA family protein [Aeromonadaceae bacterium]